MENKITTREWLPLIGMTVSAFIFNTSEFMPIGLLTDIAEDFRMTEAQAGMLITIYAYVVMLMSLPLMIAASRYPLRKLLLATISLFAISHVASAFATGFWTLLLYLDVMQLYLVDMRQIMQAIKAERYADLWKRYKVYAYGTSLCYLVLAFKDSGLCMILVGNDLLMTLLNPFVKKKYQGK